MNPASPPLDADRCWAMLASGSLGRVALSVGAMPKIVPVRYRVDADALRVQFADTGGLGAALPGSIVAFQADGFDQETQRDWTVHAIGPVANRAASPSDHDSRTYEIHPLRIEGHWLSFDQDLF